MVDHLGSLEATTPDFQRLRARRTEPLANFEEVIRITVANLAYAVLDPPMTGKLAVHGGNINRRRTRYDNRAFGKEFPKVMTLLEAAGYAEFRPPEMVRRESSSLAPTAHFADMVRSSGITFGDFGRHPDEEVLVLTRKAGPRGHRTNEFVDYPETAETRSLREQVMRINRFLAGADIAYREDDGGPPVNPLARTCTRTFFIEGDDPVAFNKNGRLFGGFWTNLRSDRRRHILIGGEPWSISTIARCSAVWPTRRWALSRRRATSMPSRGWSVIGAE